MTQALKPTQWQADVMSVPEDISLFLGGGRGRGATTLAIFLLIRAAEKYPNSHHLFVRNHLRSLSEVEDTLQMMLSGAFGARALKINRSDHVFRLPNGSTIEFAPMADVNDLAKLQGRSFDTITCDEYGNFSPAQMRWVDALRANLRGGPCPKRFVFLANPAGRGHASIMRRFIAKSPAWIPTELEDGTTWVFAPANYRDNPNLPATYARDLFASAGRDKELFRGWADGDWNIARGAILADIIDQEKQMFDVDKLPFNTRFHPSYTFLAGDWGISSPSVVYLCNKLLGPLGPYPRNSLLLMDEVSSADPDDLSVGLQWSPGRLADEINQMCNRYGVVNRFGVIDDARGFGDETIIGLMRNFGLQFQRPQKGRAENLGLMRELLFNSKESNGRPGLWISSRCRDYWQTVPDLPRDPHRPELVDTSASDHAYDAASYACSHVPQIMRQGRTIGGF